MKRIVVSIVLILATLQTANASNYSTYLNAAPQIVLTVPSASSVPYKKLNMDDYIIKVDTYNAPAQRQQVYNPQSYSYGDPYRYELR